RALMTNPELLLMDEPSEGLAPIIVHEVCRIIAHLKEYLATAWWGKAHYRANGGRFTHAVVPQESYYRTSLNL
ncbi:unnamed protein product, partial [marine sediment metagenome]